MIINGYRPGEDEEYYETIVGYYNFNHDNYRPSRSEIVSLDTDPIFVDTEV